jgi:hypothetical protein
MSNAVPLVPLLRALLDHHLVPQDAEQKRRQELVAQLTDALWEGFRCEHGRPPSGEENRRIQSAAFDEIWKEQIGQLGHAPPDVRLWSDFPWNMALSQLSSAMLVLPAGPSDPLSEEYELPGDPSRGESALREYLARVRLNEVAEPTPLSVELARLDADGFGTRLADALRQKFPAEMPAILDAVHAEAGGEAAEQTSSTTSAIAANADAGREVQGLLEALVDETQLEIFKVAQDSSKTSDQRMAAIYVIDNQVLGWTSAKWASVLRVSDAAVRQTRWWRNDRPKLKGQD